jgi:hypothetical protein
MVGQAPAVVFRGPQVEAAFASSGTLEELQRLIATGPQFDSRTPAHLLQTQVCTGNTILVTLSLLDQLESSTSVACCLAVNLRQEEKG